MDARDEEDLTIQIPPHDGSQTERSRGTFGGRQRWISGANGSGGAPPPSVTDSKGNASLLSPRGGGKGIVKSCVYISLSRVLLIAGVYTIDKYTPADTYVVYYIVSSKVTAPSVQPFLSSLGILVGEETHIVDKEVNEVAILRRVRWNWNVSCNLL